MTGVRGVVNLNKSRGREKKMPNGRGTACLDDACPGVGPVHFGKDA